MTIPQIENELRILHERDVQRGILIEQLQASLRDLRAQLDLPVLPTAQQPHPDSLAKTICGESLFQ